ncbi:MAG: PAS domain S-box protein, partial [Anaerolineaceae bacterium]|nr:PAS domain S-box protein [Anaerolineaceae bacterium]
MKTSTLIYPPLPFLDLTSEFFPYAVMTSDKEGKVTFINKAFTELTGFCAEETIGKNPREFLKSGRQSAEYYKEMYTKIMIGEPWEGYLTNVRKNGETYFEHEMIYPIKNNQGEVESFLTIKRDVTANQKNIQLFEQLNKVVEQSSELVYVTDKNGIIDYVNPAFQKITGYSNDEVIGKTPQILKSGLHSVKEYQEIWRTIASGNVLRKVIVNTKKNGDVYYQETTITPITDVDGEVTHYVATGNDITQRMLEEQESQNRLHYLEAIYAVSATLSPAKTLNELLEKLLDEILKLMKMNLGDICLLDDKKNFVSLAQTKGYGRFENRILSEKISMGIFNKVINSRQPYISKNYKTDTELNVSLREYLPENLAGITLPILKAGESIGTITLSYPASRTLSESEVSMLIALAEIAGNAIQRISLRQQTEQQLDFVRSMREIDQMILSSMDLNLSFEIILTHVLNQLKVDAASILIFDTYSNRLDFKYGKGFNSSEIDKSSLYVFESLAGQAAFDREPVFVKDLQTLNNHKIEPLTSIEGFKSYYSTPLIIKGEVKGVLEFFNRSTMDPDEIWVDMANTLAYQTAITLDTFAMFTGLQKSNHELTLAYDETIEGWSRALDLRDKETEGHTQRVTTKTIRLASYLGISGKDLTYIRWGALLHDIGKMGIPDEILLKPGKLTDEERQIMQQHTTFAKELLTPIKYLGRSLDIPYCHHEKWDGTGYPRGMKGEEIPLSARIFAIVDVWDALTSDRP